MAIARASGSLVNKHLTLVLLNDELAIISQLVLIFLLEAVLLEAETGKQAPIDAEGSQEYHENETNRENPSVEAFTQERNVPNCSHNFVDRCLINAGQLKEVVADGHRHSH